MNDLFDKFMDKITILSVYQALIYIVIGIILIPIVKRIVRKTIELRYKRPGQKNYNQGETVIKLLQSISKYIILIIVIIGVLNAFGVNTNALLASAGLVGVAIGLGAQALFKDIIAGLFFVIEDQLCVGDLVQINGFTGIIQEVGLKTTTIKNDLGEVKFIPNGLITEIINYSLANPVVFVDVSVDKKDQENAENILKKILKDLKKDIKEITRDADFLGINEVDFTSITLRIAIECRKEEEINVKKKVLKKIEETFQQSKIKILSSANIIGKKNEK